MCVEHANAIDERSTLSVYPVERLSEWKAKQIEEYDQLKQGWTINSEMAKGAIQASFSNVGVVVSDSTVHLGGEGGKAPGAGGGGGGAMGYGATGGTGGPGGEINLHGTPGEAPGAGGGGASAVGDAAVAGEGGGGEYVSVMLGPDEIGPNSSFHHFENSSRERWSGRAGRGHDRQSL